MEALLRVEHVTRRLEERVAVTLVEDVCMELHAGEFLAITGPSGSGKSSLLYLVGLLDMPTEGKVWLRDIDTTQLDDDVMARIRLSELGFVFQFHFLLPEFSSLENIMLPMWRLGRLGNDKIKERAYELLVRLGLEEHAHKLPSELSGGQRQRVAIARALANNPRIILADEPTGNLDSVSGANVAKLLKELTREEGRSVIVVTHNPTFAALADRVITIVDGKIVSH